MRDCSSLPVPAFQRSPVNQTAWADLGFSFDEVWVSVIGSVFLCLCSYKEDAACSSSFTSNIKHVASSLTDKVSKNNRTRHTSNTQIH